MHKPGEGIDRGPFKYRQHFPLSKHFTNNLTYMLIKRYWVGFADKPLSILVYVCESKQSQFKQRYMQHKSTYQFVTMNYKTSS